MLFRSSEDLDELLHVADRIVVMSGGRLVHECLAAGADRHHIGSFMGGHGHGDETHETQKSVEKLAQDLAEKLADKAAA